MAKADRSVVRNEAYRRGGLGIRERHNERKNMEYQNPDVIPERAAFNVHFKQCEGTYAEAFDRLLENGTISTKWLGKDPKIVDEMVFDVNTAYFERNGGYDYAKQFFEEAYRLAVKEAGGEQFIISAVMHADERNRALSEQLGHDVYHYHLHVIYVPVVQKEVMWTKKCKDPTLIGTLKEVITQVSHSKRWGLERNDGKNSVGKNSFTSGYSTLQDHYFKHMRAAEYTDFERGVRGSTADHLEVLEYKIQQDKMREAELLEAISEKKGQAATLDKKVEQKQERLTGLAEKIAVTKEKVAEFAEIDGMAKKTISGNYQLTPDNWKTVSNLAKESLKSRGIIKELKDKVTTMLKEIAGLKTRLEHLGDVNNITDTMKFLQALRRAPKRVMDTIADIMRKPPEQTEPKKQAEIKRKRTVNEI